MTMFRPKSVPQLVLIGFLLVTLPLVFALFSALLNVDRLTTKSQEAVLYAVRVTKSSSLLIEQITAMERTARQYQVLGDAELFEAYKKTHEAFQETARKLFLLQLNEAQWRLVNELVEKEQGLYLTLRNYPHESEMSQAALADFASIRDLASFLLSERRRFIDQEIESLQHMAERANRVLVLQLMAAVPVAVLLAVGFMFLISRPIRRIDQSIRQLGDGHLSTPIQITGPRDLESLGTQLDWLRVRLIDLEEQKNKFLDHISHELKTPLSSIREGAELLSDEVGGALTSEQRKVVAILRENSIQLQKIIENMINFRAALLRHSALYLRNVDLARVIERVAADHELAMLAKSIKLELSLTDVVLPGDEEKLTTIVDNLLSNAVKFSPAGGLIRIQLVWNDDYAMLDCMDTGPGIAPGEKEKIFDPFYQGRVSGGHVKGTGIGLSVVAEYVKLHDGAISIIEGRSSGAHFRVMLPIRPA